MIAAALAAAVCGLALGPRPRAKLTIRARGTASLENLEEHVLEYSRALSKILNERCGADDGCLVVDVQWEPPRYADDAALEMRLKLIAANKTKTEE